MAQIIWTTGSLVSRCFPRPRSGSTRSSKRESTAMRGETGSRSTTKWYLTWVEEGSNSG